MKKTKTLVVGIGNILQTDEGVGVHVVNQLNARDNLPSDMQCIDGGTLSFTLAAAIEDAERLIVIDTAELDALPGTVKIFVDDEMDDFIGHGKKSSVHEVGLQDILSIAMLQGHLPRQRALIGIQPRQFGWGDWPTREVASAIPEVCDSIFKLTEQWSHA